MGFLFFKKAKNFIRSRVEIPRRDDQEANHSTTSRLATGLILR